MKNYRFLILATVILSTVHKAKGSEWDVVELCDDFPITRSSNRPKFGGSQALDKKLCEEANILYVAITRAKRELRIDINVRSFLHNSGGLVQMYL